MSAVQAGQGVLSGSVVVEIAPPASNPPMLTEAQKFEQTLLEQLQILGDIVSNLALDCYITLAKLAYFGHKKFGDFCSGNIRQDLSRGGTK